MTDDQQAVLRLDPASAVWREVAGEIVVIDLRTSEYLGVSGSAAVLWRLLRKGTTVDELERALESAYALDPATASQDVNDFLVELQGRRLLTPAHAEPW